MNFCTGRPDFLSLLLDQIILNPPFRLEPEASGKHLDYYLDEYTFRFNRRMSRSRGMLFYRLIQQAVATTAVPYRQLVDGNNKI